MYRRPFPPSEKIGRRDDVSSPDFLLREGRLYTGYLKNAKKMKNCRKVAEKLVAKPIAKLCLADKALSFK